MRIFHFSDTHLGYSAFARIDQQRGLNQREADFYDSFEKFIDISIKERPELVIHTGDLFDSVRPSNRAISFAMGQIKRLSDAGIDFIAISGNHETPRLTETGSVFKILEHLPNCQFVFEGELKRIKKSSLEILCLPHMPADQFRKTFDDASEIPKKDMRIILMHVGVLGLGVFRTNEVNELLVNSSEIDGSADYVALGHYHNYVEVTGNCCYSGSTERLSISEAGVEKGFIDIDLERKKRKFVPLPTRKMIDIPTLDLTTANASDARKIIMSELERHEIDGAIVRMTLNGLSRESQLDLDMNAIRKTVQTALNFDLKIIGGKEEQSIQTETPHIGQLEEEFKQFLSQVSLEKLDKKRMENLAMEFFAEKET